jgi:hypothetical protein
MDTGLSYRVASVLVDLELIVAGLEFCCSSPVD